MIVAIVLLIAVVSMSSTVQGAVVCPAPADYSPCDCSSNCSWFIQVDEENGVIKWWIDDLFSLSTQSIE